MNDSTTNTPWYSPCSVSKPTLKSTVILFVEPADKLKTSSLNSTYSSNSSIYKVKLSVSVPVFVISKTFVVPVPCFKLTKKAFTLKLKSGSLFLVKISFIAS